MYLKVHTRGDRVVIAACDRDILGMKLTKGNVCVEITESFYKGDIVSETRIIEVLKDASNANLFGKKVVSCAVRCGIVDPDAVIIINGVPHAQIYRV
jgi:hypothetical protein